MLSLRYLAAPLPQQLTATTMERIYAYSGTVAGLDRRLSSPLTRFMDELHQKTRELQRRLEPTGEDFEQVADAARGDR